jgi:hypothetical protein
MKMRLEFTRHLGNWKTETRNWKMETGKQNQEGRGAEAGK